MKGSPGLPNFCLLVPAKPSDSDSDLTTSITGDVEIERLLNKALPYDCCTSLE